MFTQRAGAAAEQEEIGRYQEATRASNRTARAVTAAPTSSHTASSTHTCRAVSSVRRMSSAGAPVSRPSSAAEM